MKHLFIAIAVAALVSAPAAFAGEKCNKDKAAACEKSKAACDKSKAACDKKVADAGKSECKKACSKTASKKDAIKAVAKQ